jgi:Tfp pilus assembly protein PilO
MNPVLLNLHRLRYYLGLSGLFGLAAAMAGLVIYLFAELPAERQLQARQDQWLQLRTHPTAVFAKPARKDDSAALEEFYRQFPAMTSLPDLLYTLHAVAEAHGIMLDHGEFKFGNEEGGKLLRYQITLPVKGSYPHLRNFIDEAAHKLPTMGLSEISLKREAVGDSQVQAKLDFVLYISEK